MVSFHTRLMFQTLDKPTLQPQFYFHSTIVFFHLTIFLFPLSHSFFSLLHKFQSQFSPQFIFTLAYFLQFLIHLTIVFFHHSFFSNFPPNLALNNAQHDKIQMTKISFSVDLMFQTVNLLNFQFYFFCTKVRQKCCFLFIIIPNYILNFLVCFKMKIVLKCLVFVTKISQTCERGPVKDALKLTF